MKAFFLGIALTITANFAAAQELQMPAPEVLSAIQQQEFAFLKNYKRAPKSVRRYLNSIAGSSLRIKKKGKTPATDVQIGLWGQSPRVFNFVARCKQYVVLSYAHSGRGQHYHYLLVLLSDKTVLKAYNFISFNNYAFDFFKWNTQNDAVFQLASFDDI